jgi:diaminopimelate decarboxylase
MAAELTAAPSIAELLVGDQCLSVSGGRLAVEEIELSELARRFGTPLYVVSEGQLRRNAREFASTFSKHWPDGEVLIMPSIKANLSLALRHLLSEEGTGCDAFGAGELEAALRAGVDPALISLNGSTKDAALIERAVAVGARITLDSLAELELAREAARELGVRAEVRFRLRPWLELDEESAFHSDATPIRIATQRYKPGIPTEQLLGLDRAAIEAPELHLRGLMVHIGRQGTDPRIWGELARWVAGLTGRLADAWGGWRPLEIDLGGGFPVPRDPFGGALRGAAAAPPVPGLDEFAAAIGAGLREGLTEAGVDHRGLRLEVEPGRGLFGNAGLHLARVLHVKRQDEPIPYAWVETDTSEIFLADVVFEHNRWNAVAVDRAEEELELVADIVGVSCNLDVIVPEARLPAVEAGDVIAFLDTGAYQDANASNFNALPRPGTVLVHGDEAELIKRPETVAEVFARDRVPRRLRPSPGGVLALDHVSITCADLDRSMAFYADLLGIPVRDRGEEEGGEVAEITGLPGARIRWADLELGRGQVLELIQYLEPAGTAAGGSLSDPGAVHIALEVESADAAHRALREAGVEVRSAPVELTEPGSWQGSRCLYALDPDGVTVEIIERPNPREARA